MRQSLILLLTGLFFIASCKKDDDKTPTPNPPYTCATCVTSPEANAAFDNNSGGVYKGVIVGSTGTIGIYLFNTGTTVQALVQFDGQSATMTTNDLAGWSPGQPINNALFTGIINGDTVQALFSVGANGQGPMVNVMIPGHNVTVAIYKETSANLVRSFEGTYTGTDTGIFNLVIEGNNYSIVTDAGDVFTGTLVNGEVHYNTGVLIDGTFQGSDFVSGTWSNPDNGDNGSWTGNRTM